MNVFDTLNCKKFINNKLVAGHGKSTFSWAIGLPTCPSTAFKRRLGRRARTLASGSTRLTLFRYRANSRCMSRSRRR